MTVHMKDKDAVERKIAELVARGSSRLHVVADFDRTLTYAAKNGYKSGAFFDRVDQSPIMPFALRKKLEGLYQYYYPIETNHKMSTEEKTPFMVEWWDKYFAVLKEAKFPYSEIVRIAKEDTLELRGGFQDFFNMLHHHHIPLLIFSAGLGDGIVEILKHQKLLFPNIKIISNFIEFENGVAVGRKDSCIHTYNKNESLVKQEVTNRDNIILLGDSLGDLTMADGVKHDCLLKIGYLNFDVKNKLDIYMEGYDIVLTEDGNLSEINEILKKIIT